MGRRTRTYEVKLAITEALATALRTASKFTEFMALYLSPDIGATWISLSGCELTVSGKRRRAVDALAARYRRADEILARFGTKPFELGMADDLFPDIARNRDGYMDLLGYERSESGERWMVVPVSLETIDRLKGPLLWFLSLAKAAGVRVEFDGDDVRLKSRVWDFSAAVADEIRRLDAFANGECHRFPHGLATVEYLLWPEAEGALRSTDTFATQLQRAIETGDWRHANKALEDEGFLTRLRVDASSGRPTGGFVWVEYGSSV